MSTREFQHCLLPFFTALMLSAPLAVAAEPERGESVAPPTELIDWLSQLAAPGSSLESRARQAYEEPQLTADTVTRLGGILAEADSRLATILALLQRGDYERLAQPPEWLITDEEPACVRAQVALLVAGGLHASRNHEEVLAWLAGVEPDETVAPHLLHYYRAVAQHQLVRLEEAERSARELLALEEDCERRHVALARLILRDVEMAEPESLDHIARTMNDIRRRLGLGRSAEPEQTLQQEVLDALDKMIEDAENQQQQQMMMASGSAPPAPSAPMQESRPAELKAPGEVDQRETNVGGNWGSLPAEERDRVTQQIIRDYPSHYRQVIEAYFRSLAQEASAEESETGGQP